MNRIEKLMAVAKKQQKAVGRNREKEATLYSYLADSVNPEIEFRFLMPKPWWKFWVARRAIVIVPFAGGKVSITEILPGDHGFRDPLHDDAKIEVIDYLLHNLVNDSDSKDCETSMARFV